MSQARPTHYLVLTYPSWAHIRSEIGLSTHLLYQNPSLHITLLIPAKRSKAAALELAQYLPLDNPSRRVILHYGDDGQEDGGGMWNPRGGFREECMAQLQSLTEPLARLESIVDPITHETVTPHQIPYEAIITDLTLGAFGTALVAALKAISTEIKSPKILGFGPYNTASLAFLLVEDFGFMPRVREIVETSGQDADKKAKLSDELISNNTDLMNIPGLWPFYMHESTPVVKESPVNNIDRYYAIGRAIPTWIDGIIMGWPYVFGKDLQADMGKKFGELYQVGYSLPPSPKDEWVVEGRAGQCRRYLDDSPAESVIYISFGSAIYAPTFDQMRILLDILEELRCRYIMAEGNAPEEVKEHMRARIGVKSDKGLLVAWAPQRAILSHPSTAMFLTHGGSNSAMEAILLKVPMVQWPAGFDQPYVANEMDKLGVARELLQVRGGRNVGKPLARNGVIVSGTEDALKEEFKSVFGDMNGHWIRDIRERVEVVSEEMIKDRNEGQSFAHVQQLATLGL